MREDVWVVLDWKRCVEVLQDRLFDRADLAEEWAARNFKVYRIARAMVIVENEVEK